MICGKKTRLSRYRILFLIIFCQKYFSFCLQYEERRFELRSENEDECEKWLFVLSFLRERIYDKRDNHTNSIQITVEPESRISESFIKFDIFLFHYIEKKEKWRVSNLDIQVFNDIQAEHESKLQNFINFLMQLLKNILNK